MKTMIEFSKTTFEKFIKNAEAVTQRCSIKKIFLEISQENFTEKFTGKHCAGLRPATLLKKRPWHRCFCANFVKFQRTPFPKEKAASENDLMKKFI